MLAAPAVASPPFSLMPFTTSSQAGNLRLETTTLAPCAAICSQIERPMPRLPPVTTATLSVRSNIMICFPPSPPPRTYRRAGEQRNQLDMGRPQELVDRQQFLQPVSALLQSAGIACETAGIARGIDDAWHLGPCEFACLGRRSGARRIEQNSI